MKKIPGTLTIVCDSIVLAAVLTWFVPGGEYARETRLVNGVEREMVVGQSFHYVDKQPQTFSVFFALFKGFVENAGIIVFVLIVGGAFWILNSTRAIDTGVKSFVAFTRRCRQKKWLSKIDVDSLVLAVIMLMFSLFGSVFGMSEETIAFIVIFVPMAVSMGYDSITGVCISYLAAHVGFAGATLNPFTIGIAQGIAGIPLFSGLEYRVLCWFVLTSLAIVFVLWYARRIKKNPEKSPVYRIDQYWRERVMAGGDTEDSGIPLEGGIPEVASESASEVVPEGCPKGGNPGKEGKLPGKTSGRASRASGRNMLLVAGFLSVVQILFAFRYPFTDLQVGDAGWRLPLIPFFTALFLLWGIFSVRRSVVAFNLQLLFFTIVYLVIGVLGYHWYMMEISALFLVLGIFSGLAAGKGLDKVMSLFQEGCKDILGPAMVIGLAGGILFVLQEGKVIDTILHGLSSSMARMGETGSMGAMYGFQTCLNLVMPSGSAKAALTMPIMSQFSDLVGISRQATVLAFQFGDGFTNMITPVSGILLGVLGVARIPYALWFKWVYKFILVLILVGFLLLLPTLFVPLNGF